jgi:toxin ParE1/3/4
MAKFELTGAAGRDLTDIYIYSYRRFGERQADDYLLGLESCFSNLAEMPDMGRSIEDIRAGYYRFAHARHVIFYRKIKRAFVLFGCFTLRWSPNVISERWARQSFRPCRTT